MKLLCGMTQNVRTSLLTTIFILFIVFVQAQTVCITKTGIKNHTKWCRYSKTTVASDLAIAKKKGLGAFSVCKPTQETSTATTNKVNFAQQQKKTLQDKRLTLIDAKPPTKLEIKVQETQLKGLNSIGDTNKNKCKGLLS